MDKTIKINLGGTLFQIDEEAYKMLRDYLQAIDRKFRNAPGGNETIEDIESRIAEIFLSQKGTAGIISSENVEAMISVIGKPEDFDQEGAEGTSYRYSSGPRKLFRNPDDRVIGGVCGGIGAYADTDPVWFRILFVIFTFMFGLGFLIYLALWIALPSADNSSKKREMYGSDLNQLRSQESEFGPRYATTSKIGNATNEVFRALGKVLFIIVRIFLIIVGVALVITGFAVLFTFVLVFVFKFPGAFSTDAVGFNLAYLPDFLNYIVTPSMVPLITALIVIVVSIPFLAIIYGGVRLIFWFKARDGFIWLIGFVLWVLCAAALSIILFNEGISYAERDKTIAREYFVTKSDTLYIMSGRKIDGLNADKEISLPDEDYNVFIDDDNRVVYIRTYLDISTDENNLTSVEIKRSSSGRSRLDAIEKADRLLYNFTISGDTLLLDEFFTIPSGTKWSFDEVKITVFAPEGTIIRMDKTTERMFHDYDEDFITDPKNRFWRMTDEGLDYIEP
jgi:phage shock protein PspC (stress-responsive transcriptional regulator)